MTWKSINQKVKKNDRTYDINKKSLSCFDDQRYVLDNGVPNFKHASRKGLVTFLEYTCLFHSLVRIYFYFEKGSYYSYLSIQEKNKS